MPHSRLLQAVNVIIGLLVVVFVAALYWFMVRPLPETSGEITAPISAQASITRDALGVPHIKAANWEDALFLEGYAMAQDRLFQMDSIRRLAGGQLAEVVGEPGIQSDRDALTFRLPRLAEAHAASLAGDDLKVFAAFARGVNQYINTHRDRLPAEFSILGYDPRPWTPRDSMLAGLEMYRQMTLAWRGELTKQQMLDRGDRQKVEYLFPLRTGQEISPGSNAWAISGAHTASGKPILANDPHLNFALPSPWWLVHLEAPGLNVTGATIVGLPAVLVGHNDRIAWGITNMEFDVQDLYREHVNQAGQYEFRGHAESTSIEREVVVVKGGKRQDLSILMTRHGPVVATDGQQAYTMRWTAAEPGGVTFPFFDIARARNWQEFTSAVSRFGGPAQNFVYADVEGNIGYQASGRLPIRQKCMGDVPSEGWTGECEWDGYVPFDQLPHFFNPASGMVITANQSPFPKDWPYAVNGAFAPHYRSSQIQARLQSKAKWEPQEMLAIQKDVYSAFHDFLSRQIVAAWDRQKAAGKKPDPQKQQQLEAAITTLRNWNGQMEIAQAAPMVANLTYGQLRKLLADSVVQGSSNTYLNRMTPVVVERLLRERPKDWFPDYDALIVRALIGGVDEGIKMQGSNVAKWDYGQTQRLQVRNPVLSRLPGATTLSGWFGSIPVVGKFFDVNLGPVSMSGAPTTVKQYGGSQGGQLGPSLRIVTDLGNLDGSMANLTAGESGQLFSSHYRDQFDSYYVGKSFPMQFGKVQADAVLTVRPK